MIAENANNKSNPVSTCNISLVKELELIIGIAKIELKSNISFWERL